MKSATWTAVSFMAVSALGAASFAFAGCTVTSGTIDENDEGGTGLPADKDSGTAAQDSATADSAPPNACPSNTKQTAIIINATCQAALETECCAQLTACYNISPAATDAGATSLDCNGYAACIGQCSTASDVRVCEEECDLATSGEVQSAYNAIAECSQTGTASKASCK